MLAGVLPRFNPVQELSTHGCCSRHFADADISRLCFVASISSQHLQVSSVRCESGWLQRCKFPMSNCWSTQDSEKNPLRIRLTSSLIKIITNASLRQNNQPGFHRIPPQTGSYPDWHNHLFGRMKAIYFSALLFSSTCFSVPPLPVTTLTTEDCEITSVRASGEVINIWFTGRWTSSEKVLKFADTDKNGIVIMRNDDTDTAAWHALRDRAQAAEGRLATIRIATTGGWAIRGGIPGFKMPPAEVTIDVKKPSQ
jgi:hypothetical protein